MQLEIRTGTGGAGVAAVGVTGRRVAGHAVVFGAVADLGDFTETIQPTAVDRAVRGADVAMLWSHNSDIVLARTTAKTLNIRKDSRGLAFDAALPRWAEGHAESIRRGDVSQMSFGFVVVRDNWSVRNGRPHRDVEDLILREISAVAWPAYTTTSISTIDRSAATVKRDARWRDERWIRLQLAR